MIPLGSLGLPWASLWDPQGPPGILCGFMGVPCDPMRSQTRTAIREPTPTGWANREFRRVLISSLDEVFEYPLGCSSPRGFAIERTLGYRGFPENPLGCSLPSMPRMVHRLVRKVMGDVIFSRSRDNDKYQYQLPINQTTCQTGTTTRRHSLR